MTKKSFFCVAAIGITMLAGMVSGCGRKEAAESGTKVHLEFYNRKREVYELMEEIIKEFNESQDRIEVTQVMNSDVEVPLRIAAAKNEFPDIILLGGIQNTETTEYIMGGYLLELEEMSCVERIQETYRSSLTYDGHIYQLPLALGFEGIYVNKTLFEEAGLEIPNTYEALCSVSEEILDQGKTPFIFADTEGWTVHQNWECIQSVSTDDFGQLYTAVAEGETTFWDQAVTREAMQKLIDLHAYTSEEFQTLNYDEAMNRFAEGEAFMFMQGSWAYRNIMQQNPHMELEMIPFPADEGEEQYFTLWVDSSVGIAKTCQYPEEAKEFLEYLMQPEVLQAYLDEESIIGCVEGARMYTDFAPRINELIRSGQAKMDATWIPSQTSVIRDEDIASLMPDATEEEIKAYMDVLTKSLQKNSELFLEVKEKIG